MKKYKLSYVTSCIIGLMEIYATVYIVIFPFFLTLIFIDEGNLRFAHIIAGISLGLFFIIFLPFIIFIISWILFAVFNKKYILLSDDELICKNETIKLENIKHINFVFPVMSRSNSEPYGVCIKYFKSFHEQNKFITIDRFPLRALFKIRKLKGKEIVTFENIKQRYIKIPLILFSIGIGISLFTLIIFS